MHTRQTLVCRATLWTGIFHTHHVNDHSLASNSGSVFSYKLWYTVTCTRIWPLLPWWHRKALTQWPPFLNVIVLMRSKVFVGTWNIRLNFMASEFFGRQRECRFYTAGCGNKMAVCVTRPRALNEAAQSYRVGPCIHGIHHVSWLIIIASPMLLI